MAKAMDGACLKLASFSAERCTDEMQGHRLGFGECSRHMTVARAGPTKR